MKGIIKYNGYLGSSTGFVCWELKRATTQILKQPRLRVDPTALEAHHNLEWFWERMNISCSRSFLEDHTYKVFCSDI